MTISLFSADGSPFGTSFRVGKFSKIKRILLTSLGPRVLTSLDFSAPAVQEFPNTAAGLATLLGDAAATADSIYLCDDTSGAMVDALGTADLSAVGVPLYEQPANGLYNGTDLISMRSLEAMNTGARFEAAADTVHAVGTGSFAHVVVFRVKNTNINQYILRKRTTNGFYLRVHTSGQIWFFLQGTSASPLIFDTNPYDDGGWHVAIVGYHAGDTESHLRTNMGSSTDVTDPGDLTNTDKFAVLDSAPGTQIKYLSSFSGAAAEALLDLGDTAITNFWKHATDPTGEITTQTRASVITIPVGEGATATFSEDTLPIGYSSGFMGAKYGLCVNRATENLITYSDDIDLWAARTNMTVTANDGNGSSGFRSASSLVATANDGYTYDSTITPATSTEYTFSALVKRDGGSDVAGKLLMWDSTAGSSLGEVAFTATDTYQIVQLSFTTAAGANDIRPRVYVDVSGESIFAEQVQLETGPYRTFHKKTTGGAESLAISTYTANLENLAITGEIDARHVSMDNKPALLYRADSGAPANRKQIYNTSTFHQTSLANQSGVTEEVMNFNYLTVPGIQVHTRQMWDQTEVGKYTGGVEHLLVVNGITKLGAPSPFEGTTGGDNGTQVEIGHAAGGFQGSLIIQSIKTYDKPTVATAKSVPQTVAEYQALGFPAPTRIWDMQTNSLPAAELLVGTDPFLDQSLNSAGLLFAQPTGLPNGELGMHRTTVNTSRAFVSDAALGDVGTTERMAVGVLVRYDDYGAGTNVFMGKRSAQGFDFRLASGQPQSFGRPLSGGDIVTTISTVHPNDTWHYLIYIVDREPGVELTKVFSELGSTSASLSGKGTFTSTAKFGMNTSSRGVTEYAAYALWEGEDVALLTSAMPALFLTKSGV